MDKQNLENHLHHLRERLKNQTMSVLIGAGFSKNVDPQRYPSWFQLLEKLVVIMHGERYEAEFRRYSRQPTVDPDDKDYKEYLKEEISLYIKTTGYLKVVSEYIRVTGIRESIDSFIEENTPIVVQDNGCDFLQLYENGVKTLLPLQAESLDLHRKIIRLPWNNVYTTNYDNLIEYCVDNDVLQRIKSKIANISGKLDPLAQERQICQAKINQLEEDLRACEQLLQNSMLAGSSNGDPDLAGLVEEKKDELIKLDIKLDGIKHRYIELSNTRAELLRSQENCFTVVSHSSALSLKKHRNVIKLHGTINPAQGEFAFDEDHHKRYVISNEDYETYPTKHEAFTQLMRISLLQDYFLLIGFSGDDPNFLAWISWVRDVLRSAKASENPGKIYLIDLKSDDKISNYKKQFFANHKIIHIPILSSESIAFLSQYHDSKLHESDVRNVLSAFLNFLGEVSPVNFSQISLEKLYREEYRNFFRNLPFYFDKNTPIDITYFLENIYVVRENRQFNRITSIQSSFTFSKINFIGSYGELVSKFPNFKDEFFEVALICLIDLHIPFHSIVTTGSRLYQDIIARMSDFDSSSADLQWLQLFNSLWFDSIDDVINLSSRLKNISANTKNQMIALAYLFNLDFSNLQRHLESWDTSDHWTTIKAGFQSYTDISVSRHMLKKNVTRVAQEELLGIELQLHLSGFDRSIYLRDMFDQMEHAGLSKLTIMIDRLLEDLIPKINRVETLGNNKFAGSEGLHLTNASEERSALQVFGLLMESGFPISTPTSVVASIVKIFPAITIAMRFYPIPVLAYALQYDDAQFLKRVGQEFAYHPKVDPYHESIIKNFATSYFNVATPPRFKVSQLQFLSEFVISVNTHIWEDFFMDVWRESLVKCEIFGELRNPHAQLAIKCLPLIEKETSIALVLSNCLDVGPAQDIDGRIRCLFHLARNPGISLFSKNLRLSVGNQIVSNLIDAATVNNWHLVQILNSYDIFTEKDKIEVQNILINLDLTDAEPRLIETIFSLVDDWKPVLRKHYLEGVIKNKALWRSGISDDRVTVRGPVAYIDLRLLRLRSGKVSLANKQARAIYDTMLLEVEKISDYMQRWNNVDRFLNFRSILQQMLWFLEDEYKTLQSLTSYNQTVSVVTKLFLQNMDGISRMEALLSDNAVDINWAILGISRDLFDYEKQIENEAEIRQVISRASMKNPVGLESCIVHLVRWFYHFRESNNMKDFRESAKMMLDRYLNDNYPVGCEIPLIEEHLIQLAFVLRLTETESESIKYFCEKITTSRFNTIRYSLYNKLRTDQIL